MQRSGVEEREFGWTGGRAGEAGRYVGQAGETHGSGRGRTV